MMRENRHCENASRKSAKHIIEWPNQQIRNVG